MPSITKEDATLIAAGIAAFASVVKLAADAISARGTATRAAHRAVLAPHLSSLAKSIHAAVAGATIVHDRAKDDQAPANAMKNAQAAASDLKEYRLEIKYALPGLEEPLKTLTRAPDWIANVKGTDAGESLITCLQSLSSTVDKTISRSYRRGRPPTRWEQWRLKRADKRVRDAWDSRPLKRSPRTSSPAGVAADGETTEPT